MHDMLFILIWPLTAICPFLRGARFALGIIMFLACQMLIWHTTMKAMSAPNWDESAGDWLVPIIITLPAPVFVALILGRLLFSASAWLLSRYFPSEHNEHVLPVIDQESPLLVDNSR